MRLAKRLAFLHLDNFFGVTRGEQPLSRGSSASKSLVVFWFSFDIKREQSALMKERSAPRHRRATLVLFGFSFGAQKRTNRPLPLAESLL